MSNYSAIKKDIFDQQKELSATQTQYQKVKQSLAEISQGQNWLRQLKTPIQIVDIKKTLPKRGF